MDKEKELITECLKNQTKLIVGVKMKWSYKNIKEKVN